MKLKSDKPHCLLLEKYITNILTYTKDMSEQEFTNSSVTYDACILNFINIGEQAKSLSEEFKTKHSELPYRKIIGLRNIAAHSYEGLEAIRLYKVIKEDLPTLHKEISKIIQSANFA